MPPPTRRRVVRLAVVLLLGLLLTAGGLAVQADAAWAAPSPSPTPSAATSPAPSPTPGATTSATPSPAPTAPDDSDDDNPGLFDIGGQIRKAVNDLIAWVARTGLRPVLDTLGDTVLATPDLTGNPQVRAIWTTCLVAANAIFVLFIVAGGFIIMGRESLQSRYGLKEIAPRVVVAGVAANTSLLICGKAIEFTNALTAAIAGQGVDGKTAATALEQMFFPSDGNTASSGGQPEMTRVPPVLFSLLLLAALVMAIVVLIMFIARTALLVLLIGVAPLALTCHATPQTEGLAYTWWRALAACLSIQIGQALIVLVTLRVFLTPAGPEQDGGPTTNQGMLGLLVCLTMLWLLIKLPGWMGHLVLGRLGRRQGLVGQLIGAVLMVKTLGALAGARRGTSHTTVSGGRGGPPGTGTAGAARPVPTRPGTRPGTTARSTRPTASSSPIGTARGRTRPPRPPAGPAAFSHAPTSQTPAPPPDGPAGSPVFSHGPQPATPRPVPAAAAAVAPRFSHQPGIQQAQPASGTAAGAVRFSHTPGSGTPRRAAGPVPAVGFSAAPRPQTAPSRPPAPATPVFSSPTGMPSPRSPSPTGTGRAASSSRAASPSRPARRPVPVPGRVVSGDAAA